jgi:RNA polymerase sigma-70 factor (ECF subfamily)
VAVSPTLVSQRGVARVAEPAAESAGLLYEQYYDRIFGYCLYQLGSREEAEDAAQTTFMWAFRGLRRGVVPRSEASWLFTIAQNACRARHRSRGRRREREVLSDPVTLADMSAAPMAETDDLMGLEEALERMPELQRRAILLREWRGFSYKEIAEELELSNAAVETLIFRARRSLAQLLSGAPAPKRARRWAVDFGSMAAAVKAFLGTGTAAKVAAGVAAAVIAATVAGSAERTPAKQQPSHAGVAPAAKHEVLAPRKARGASKTPTAKSERAENAKPKKNPAAPAADDPLPVVPSVTDRPPLDSATAAVGETLANITKAVTPVTDVVAPVTDELL